MGYLPLPGPDDETLTTMGLACTPGMDLVGEQYRQAWASAPCDVDPQLRGHIGGDDPGGELRRGGGSADLGGAVPLLPVGSRRGDGASSCVAFAV